MGFLRSFRRQMERNQKVSRKSRKLYLEPLEPRLLLSADSLLGGGATSALAGGLNQFADRLYELVDDGVSSTTTSEALFQAYVPGVMQAGEDNLELVQIKDLLVIEGYADDPNLTDSQKSALDNVDAWGTSEDGDVTLAEAFDYVVVSQAKTWLESWDHTWDDDSDSNTPEVNRPLSHLASEFATFLNNLTVPGGLGDLFTFDINNTTVSISDGELDVTFNLNLDFKHDLYVDLGAQADKLEIAIDTDLDPDNNATENQITVYGGLNIQNLNFGLTPSNTFFVAPNALIEIGADSGSGTDPASYAPIVWDFADINIGFLGMNATGTFVIDANVLVDMVDPSHPDALGVTDANLTNWESSFTATGTLPSDGSLSCDVILDITIAGVETRVTIEDVDNSGGGDPVAALVGNINAALATAGLDSLLEASSAGNLTLSYKNSPDASALGFNNESYNDLGDIDGGALTILGETAPRTVNFYLAVNSDTLPVLVTVNTTPEDDDANEDSTLGDLSIFGLSADVQSAIDAALGGSVVNVFIGGDGTVGDPYSLTLVAVGAVPLRITRTFALDTDREITTEELQNAPTEELLGAVDDPNAALDVDLSLSVITTGGVLNWASAPAVQLHIDANPFDPADVAVETVETIEKLSFDLTYDGTNSLIDAPSAGWQKLLDFTVIGAPEVLGLFGQISTWLDRLVASDLFAAYDIALVDSALSDVLSLSDMIKDALIFNDGDDGPGGDNADENKLLEYVNDEFRLTYDTVQTLAQSLDTVLGTGIDLTDIVPTYDPDLKELTYNVSLSHKLVGVEKSINFMPDDPDTVEVEGPDLGSIFNVYADATVKLEATGYFDAVLGFTLGNDVNAITSDTLLADLNGGVGVQINENLALTSSDDITPLIGRLTADATFYVTVDTGSGPTMYTVTLRKTADSGDATAPYTDNNQTIDDLRNDLNTALLRAVSGAHNAGEYVEFIDDGERVYLVAKTGAGVESFQIDASSGNTAFTQLGLQPKTAATVSLLHASAATDVSPDADVRLTITFYEDGSATSTDITVGTSATAGNLTLTDLAIDFNNAFTGTALEGKLLVTRLSDGFGDRLVLNAVDADVDSFELAITSGATANQIAAAKAAGFDIDAEKDKLTEIGVIPGVVASVDSLVGGLILRAPDVVSSGFGRLSGDASFVVAISLASGSTLSKTVTVSKADTATNVSVDDLVIDINNALAAPVSLNGHVVAENDLYHIRLRAIDPNVVGITVTATADTPATDDLGFATTASETPVLEVKANKAAPVSYGIVDDATITITVDTTDYVATLKADNTLANRSIYDLAADLSTAFNKAFLGAANNPFVVTVQTGQLVVGLKTSASGTSVLGDPISVSASVTGFSISGAPGNLHINTAADDGDLLIEAQNGTQYRIILDETTDGLADPINGLPSNPTVGDVIAAINTQTSNNVLAIIGGDGSSIWLEDTNFVPGADGEFRVSLINGSPAAVGLGIFGADVNTLNAADNQDPDGFIKGARVGTVQLIDRFFLKEQSGKDMLSADLSLSLPDGVEASATFGFAGVRLFSDSGAADTFDPDDGRQLPEPIDLFDADVGIGLKAQTTLGDLFTALANPTSLLGKMDLPSFAPTSTNEFSLKVEVVPDLSIIGVEAGAELVFTINSLGSLEFVDTDGDSIQDDIRMTTLPDIAVAGNTYFDASALANFEDISFSNILDALEAISGFLNQFSSFSFLDAEIPLLGLSVNEILDVADRFAVAVEDIQQNPAGGIQLLEQKIREAFNLPTFADDTARDAFFAALGIPDPTSLFELALDTLSTTDDLLRVDLRLPVGFSEGLSIDLDLGEALGVDLGPIDIQGGAGLGVEGYLDVQLSFAVDLTTLDVYLYDGLSGVWGGLSAYAENLTFNAAIGPIGAFIKDGVVNADITFAYENDSAADAHTAKVIDADSDDNWSNGFDPTSELSTVLANFAASLTGELMATLPVYVPTESDYLGDIELDISAANSNALSLTQVGDDFDLNIPNLANALTLPDFASIDLSSINPFNSIPLMLDAVDFFLEGLQGIMDGEVFGFELPFIGDQLSAAAGFIDDLRSDIIQPLRQFTEQAPELAERVMQHLLFAILGPGSAGLPDLSTVEGEIGYEQNLFGFLGLTDPIDGLDILSKFTDGSALPVGEITQSIIDTFLPFSDAHSYEWQFRVGDTWSPTVDIDFDIGFPGLGLEADIPLKIDFTWDLALGIGFSEDLGPYIIVDNTRQVGGETVADELYLDVEVAIDPAFTGIISGELGFLQLDIVPLTDDFDSVLLADDDTGNDVWGDAEGDYTHFGATFGVDLLEKGATDDDARTLTFSELGKLDADIDLVAEAEVNLSLTAKFNEDLMPDAVAAILPQVTADFVLDWGLDVAGLIAGDVNIGDSLNLVAFNDVTLDLGSFLGDFLGPVVDKIQEVTEPLQPIIDIVTARIPVLSDLAGKTITLIDLAGMTGYVEPAMIYAIADIITFVNSIPADPGFLGLEIGDFVLIGPGDGGTGGLGGFLSDPNFSMNEDNDQFSLADGLPGGFNDSLAGFQDLLGGLDTGGDSGAASTKSTVSGLLDGSGTGSSGFAFPFLENPSEIFGLLLGRDIALVTYDLAPFGMDFNYTQKFPIWGPIFASVSAGLGITIDLAFGYDTFGVRTFADGGFSNPLDLLAGFFVSDTDIPSGTGGTDVPELVLKGEVFAGVEVNLGVASAGVEGGLILTVNFDLYDPDSDGRVRVSELLGSFLYEFRAGNPLLAPIAIFDVYGDVAAQLRAYVEVLFFEKTFEITPPITLFEFSIDFDREPILATERGDGSLLLNVGPNAASRLNGDFRDISETINVKSLSGNKVAVWSDQLGVSQNAAQEYTIGTDRLIVAYGGEGDDVIDLTGVTDATIRFEIEGGTGNDIIKAGAGRADLSGDGGDDTLWGGDSGDVIFGGDGNDTIKGNGGKDLIFGDNGRISYAALSDGADPNTALTRLSLFVLPGDKDGTDKIEGGGEDDVIFGGGGIDTILGDAGADLIIGDGGSFEFVSNDVPKSDGRVDVTKISTRGDGTGDRLFGNAGNDTILGGVGNDWIDGGQNDDQLYGGRGFDVIYGGSGVDRMYGGTEDDIMFGFRDPEYAALFLLRDPTSYSETADTDASLDGGDIIKGEDGNDYIRGNVGEDTIDGGRGADIIFGDENGDTIYGGTGPDIIFGGANNKSGDKVDFIDAGDGNDIVFGDDGLLVYYGFYADANVPRNKGIAVDETITGSLVRADDSTGDRLIGDGALTLRNGFADDDPDNSSDDLNDRTLDLIITDLNVTTDGDDNIVGGNSHDIVLGGAGDDTVFGDFDPADIPGGPRPTGKDLLIGDGGRVEYQDRRYSYIATIAGGVGIDTISGNDGDDYIFGGSSGDFLYGFEPTPTIRDLLEGVTDNDVILGDNGEIQFDEGVIEYIATTDTSNATGGSDQAYGFKGDDIILGGVNASSDYLYGDVGNDVILGDNGALDFDTGDGDLSTLDLVTSFLDGLGGIDYISGKQGADTLIGGTAGDFIYGDDDTASSNAEDGDDIILGDNGQIVLSGTAGRLLILGSAVQKIETTETTLVHETYGGADYVEGNAGGDVILGGVNNGGIDNLYGDAATPKVALDGRDVILGDNGFLDFAYGGDTNLNTLDLISSNRDNLGGVDWIFGNANGDTLIGGNDGDLIYGDDDVASAAGSDGDDIILGDNGDITLEGLVGQLKILGSAVKKIETTDTAESTGGADTIEGNANKDIIFGGVNNVGIDELYGDRIDPTEASKSADNDDVILGDNGELNFAFDGDTVLTTLDLIRAYPDGLGGEDWISGNVGSDVGIGGNDGDKIYGDDDSASALGLDTGDILIGDNVDIFLIGTVGQRIVLDTAVDYIITTDDEEATGGADLIEGNADDDVIVGGVNGDDLYGDAANPKGSLDGDDIILGDNAVLDWTYTDDMDDRETLDLIATLAYASDDTLLGGRDNIFGNAGDDVALGGSYGDLIIGDNDESVDTKTPGAADGLEAYAGADILIGDQGQLVYKNGLIALIETTDLLETDGGVDYIEGNDYGDIIMGGVAGDVLIGESQYGNAVQQGDKDYVNVPGNDIIIGDEGRLRYDRTASDTLVSDSTGTVFEIYSVGDGDATTLDLIETFKTGNVNAEPGALGGADWIFGNEGADIAMGGTDGDDIYGDFYAALTLDPGTWEVLNPVTDVVPARAPVPGEDTLIGDGGQITYHDEMTTLVRSIEPEFGGFDRIQGNDWADTIIGGQDGDSLWGEAPSEYQYLIRSENSAPDAEPLLGTPRGDNDWILGDNGRLDYILDSDVVAGRPDINRVTLDGEWNTLDRVSTTDPTQGGDDVIRGNAADDTIFGGTGKDRIWGDTYDILGGTAPDGDDGKDLVFGDHGKIYPTLPTIEGNEYFINNNFFAIDTQEGDLGDDDVIFGNGNDDTLLGQQGDDVIFGGTENDILIGGHNVLNGHDDMDDMDAAQIAAITSVVLADKDPSDINDINDVMDGGSEEDILAGDNAIVIRQVDSISPRFQYLTAHEIYSMVDTTLEDLINVNVGFTPNIPENDPKIDPQAKPDSTVGYTVILINHSANIESDAAGAYEDPRWFGNDVMAGGSEDDLLFGELGDDIMQGDGSIEITNDTIGYQMPDNVTAFNPSPTVDPSFVIPDDQSISEYFEIADELQNEDLLPTNLKTLLFLIDEDNDNTDSHIDGDDYMEGNGGNDRMYGNLGQDDMIGGSSILFGLDDTTADFYGVDPETDFARPDGADLMYGGAGNRDRLARNDFVGDGIDAPSDETFILTEERHAVDADVMMGDNANIYRLVRGGTAYPVDGENPYDYLQFDYDQSYGEEDSDTAVVTEDRGDLHIKPRAVELLDYEYTLSFDDTNVTATFDGIGYGDLMYGESGDDIIHGMTGDDVLFGNSEDDDLYGQHGNDWISGGTGEDGILGDDGLIRTSRNNVVAETLYGIDALHEEQVFLKKNDEVDTLALNAVISSPGEIQRAVINVDGELKKTVDLIAFNLENQDPFYPDASAPSVVIPVNDIIFGGLNDDWIHAGDGDDAILGGEALPFYYEAKTYDENGELLDFGFDVVNEFMQTVQNAPVNTDPDLTENPFWFDFAPYNPGEILRYEGKEIIDSNFHTGKTKQEFALYDEFFPRRKIMLDDDGNAVELAVDAIYDWVLNFDELEGPNGYPYGADEGENPDGMATDGDDVIFGDLGNDWIVGGTGRDHMYGGRGDDLLNMDDNHDSGEGGKYGPHDPLPDPLDNRASDEYQAYADIVYGGAGRDVMIMNTGADRAIDWVGEYNSYIVPFAPFGAFHISRTLQPQVPEFVIALSISDGIDTTIPDGARYVEQKTADVRVDDPVLPEFDFRNGEPYGELGMVRQTDFDWFNQTGAPNDPQPGNLQGKREIMRRELFTDDEVPNHAFAKVTGKATVTSMGKLEVAPLVLGESAVNIYHLDKLQPSYMEILATINANKDKAGYKSNAYIIFDFQSATDFKFAGVDVGLDKIQIGHYTEDGWIVDKQIPMQLKDSTDYDLTLILYGTVATIWVDENVSMSFDFGNPLNDGYIGLGTDNATARFDDWQVQKLPPTLTFQIPVDFSSPDPFEEMQGAWTIIDDQYVGIGDPAVSTWSLDVAQWSLLEYQAVIDTDSMGGLVFDYYSSDDFKFAAIDAVSDQVVIGHHTAKGWVIDADVDWTINPGTGYTLGISMLGSSVSVTLNGQAIMGHVFNSILNDGEIGLFSEGGATTFDDVLAQGDDPACADNLTAAVAPDVFIESDSFLTYDALDAIVDEAIERWTDALGIDDALVASLHEVSFRIVDFSDLTLGRALDDTILIDADAAGYGWFVDTTPYDDVEFSRLNEEGELVAESASDAYGDMDLLTVVMHELGHVLGLEDLDPDTHDLMSETLDAGVRQLADDHINVESVEANEADDLAGLVLMDAVINEAEVIAPAHHQVAAAKHGSSWLTEFLTNGAGKRYNRFDPKDDIKIVLFDEDEEAN